MPLFRIFCGGLCMLLALIFLVANTALLGRYGFRSGADEFESIFNMVVAGSVPTALAMMPFFLALTWRPGRFVDRIARFSGKPKRKWQRGRPNGMVLIGILLYGVFIAFNFMGAIGSIAHQRSEFVDRREGSKSDAERWREARQRKMAELAQLKASRVARYKNERASSTVKADLDGARVHAFWSQTKGCEDGKGLSKGHSRFCGAVFGWRGELGAAELIEKLQAEVDELDRKLETPGARIASTDPQGEVLAAYTNFLTRSDSWTAAHVRVVQPLIWFSLLELSCMFLFAMSLLFFRVSPASMRIDEPAPALLLPVPPPTPPEPAQERPMAAILGALRGEDPELQAAVYARFWADCTRPMPGHKETATAVYAAYRAYCARPENNVVPYAFAEFARRAGEMPTSTIGSTTWLVGILLSEPMGAV